MDRSAVGAQVQDERVRPPGGRPIGEAQAPEHHAGHPQSPPPVAGVRIPGAEDPPDGGRRVVTVRGRKLVIVRAGEERFACENQCLHAGVRLSAGIQQDTVLECRWHHWRFDLRTGSVEGVEGEEFPFESFETYRVHVEDDDLVIEVTPQTRLRRRRCGSEQ